MPSRLEQHRRLGEPILFVFTTSGPAETARLALFTLSHSAVVG
ncbi:unnamed protein product, partial [Protopolystoma xenopodis]